MAISPPPASISRGSSPTDNIAPICTIFTTWLTPSALMVILAVLENSSLLCPTVKRTDAASAPSTVSQDLSDTADISAPDVEMTTSPAPPAAGNSLSTATMSRYASGASSPIHPDRTNTGSTMTVKSIFFITVCLICFCQCLHIFQQQQSGYPCCRRCRSRRCEPVQGYG